MGHIWVDDHWNSQGRVRLVGISLQSWADLRPSCADLLKLLQTYPYVSQAYVDVAAIADHRGGSQRSYDKRLAHLFFVCVHVISHQRTQPGICSRCSGVAGRDLEPQIDDCRSHLHGAGSIGGHE